MTQTNQNKDYSWLSELLKSVRDAGALDDNNGAEDWTISDKKIDEVAAAIQQKIDKHYKHDPLIPPEELRTALESWWMNCNGTGTGACPDCKLPHICSWHSARLDDLELIFSATEEHYIGKGEAIDPSGAYHDGYRDGSATAKHGMVPESEVEQRCIEARVDELQKLPRVNLDKPHEHKSQKYRDYGKFLVTTYLPKRIEQLSTNNKDTLERSGDE